MLVCIGIICICINDTCCSGPLLLSQPAENKCHCQQNGLVIPESTSTARRSVGQVRGWMVSSAAENAASFRTQASSRSQANGGRIHRSTGVRGPRGQGYNRRACQKPATRNLIQGAVDVFPVAHGVGVQSAA